jgi:hypothetical protein
MTPRQRGTVVAGGLIQLLLQWAALRDLRRRRPEDVRGPRWAWVAVTFVNTIGPLAYFALGRRRTPSSV